MERLIEKKENGRFSYYVPIAENITVKMANKLGKFEDFMEEQGFESLEELAKELRILKDYKSDWERWHKLAFEYNEEINADKKIIFNLKQENEKLQYRWEKLKEWVENKMEVCPNEEWYDFEEMFCEMQELELTDLVREKEK